MGIRKVFKSSFSCSRHNNLSRVLGLDPEGSFRGGGFRGGGTSRRRLEPSGVRKPLLIGGGSYVSENAFQAILKPFFPYSITSILSKVRHSNPSGVLLIFSHKCRRKLFFWVQNFESDIFWGFQKNEY